MTQFIDTITRKEFGVFLEAVGNQMRLHDLSFGAALDGHSDSEMFAFIVERLEPNGPADPRALQLLSLDLEDTLYLLGSQE